MTHSFIDTDGDGSPGPALSGAPVQISADGYLVTVLATLADSTLMVSGKLFTPPPRM